MTLLDEQLCMASSCNSCHIWQNFYAVSGTSANTLKVWQGGQTRIWTIQGITSATEDQQNQLFTFYKTGLTWPSCSTCTNDV